MLWSTKIELAKNVRKEANGLLDLVIAKHRRNQNICWLSHSILSLEHQNAIAKMQLLKCRIAQLRTRLSNGATIASTVLVGVEITATLKLAAGANNIEAAELQ